jgi:hypothetical protein
MIFEHQTMRKRLLEDIKDSSVAFLVWNEKIIEMTTEQQEAMPEVMHAFFGDGLQCIPYNNDIKICFADDKRS